MWLQGEVLPNTLLKNSSSLEAIEELKSFYMKKPELNKVAPPIPSFFKESESYQGEPKCLLFIL
jgi:hypothetical protein